MFRLFSQLLKLYTLLALLCVPALATNFTYGAWKFTLPDDAKQSLQDGIRAFRVDNAVYLFTPPEPLAGRTLEAVAAATIKDITQNNAGGLQGIGKRTLEDGTVLLPFSGTVPDSKAGAGNIQVYFFFARNDQWGLALLMIGGAANQDEVMAPLASVKFAPITLEAQQQATQIAAPRLPALPWATPAHNRMVSSVPSLNFPAARKQGLNPNADLLPDIFDCYFVGEYFGRDLRAMSPTPDMRIQVSAGGTYAFNDGAARSSGRWTQTRGERGTLNLEGPLNASKKYVYNDDAGQTFKATHAASKRQVYCYQNGPRAELLRLELTTRRIGEGELTCQDAGGGAAYRLTFGSGTYTTPKGTGRVRLGFSGDDSGDWQGLASFTGGPYDLSTGTMDEDEDGNRSLIISEKNTISGFLYSSSETTPIALCRAKVMPKPTPLYGRNAAPKTGVKGGPDGLFVSLQSRPYMSGMILLQNYGLELSLFRPDGYALTDIDPTELGGLPDCSRTKPNGDPFCAPYELKGGQLRFLDDEDGEAFSATKTGFKLGDTEYGRMPPLSAKVLAGVFSTEDFSGSGPAGGTAFGGVGSYNSLSSGYEFTPDGQFQWKYSSSSSTLISPNMVNGGGAVGGGGSTRTDGGQGTYSLKDNWLTLKFTDGRAQRLYVYDAPEGFYGDNNWYGKGESHLNIGGTWLNKAPGK